MSDAQFDVDGEPTECDRCEKEIHPLAPVTSIQFGGGVDAHKLVCHDCIQVLIQAWNSGLEKTNE